MGESRDTNRTGTGYRYMSAAFAIHETLDRELPCIMRAEREPAKVISFKCGVSKRTIEAIRQSEHGISAHALLALAATYPSVRALVLRLIGETESDPSRLLNEIAKLVQGRGQ